MKILFECDADEEITNFRVAEAVCDLCLGQWNLDAEAIAKMILLYVEAGKRSEQRLREVSAG